MKKIRYEQRLYIRRRLDEGATAQMISKELDISPITLYSEIRRGTPLKHNIHGYDPELAQKSL